VQRVAAPGTGRWHDRTDLVTRVWAGVDGHAVTLVNQGLELLLEAGYFGSLNEVPAAQPAAGTSAGPVADPATLTSLVGDVRARAAVDALCGEVSGDVSGRAHGDRHRVWDVTPRGHTLIFSATPLREALLHQLPSTFVIHVDSG
jgi:hypothetical protein